MILFFVFGFYWVQPSAQAAQRVIDLGQMEIEGELRRPQMRWVDSGKRLKELLPRIHGERFEAIERELLKPMTRTRAQAFLKSSKKTMNKEINK